MANMSYCRFENTTNDLEDCLEHLDRSDLSDSETEYREKLVRICSHISEAYGDEE